MHEYSLRQWSAYHKYNGEIECGTIILNINYSTTLYEDIKTHAFVDNEMKTQRKSFLNRRKGKLNAKNLVKFNPNNIQVN